MTTFSCEGNIKDVLIDLNENYKWQITFLIDDKGKEIIVSVPLNKLSKEILIDNLQSVKL